MTQERQICQNCKNEFRIAPEDFVFYEKIQVPPPTWCPECRMVRRMLWRNEQALYHRKDGEGKEIISIFAPEKPYAVYRQKQWWSDTWDAMEYGKLYDFTRPFFLSWLELFKVVPLMALQNFEAVNSDYCTNCSRNKNCYLVTAGFMNESVMYANRALFCKDSSDLHLAEKLELSFSAVDCSGSFRLFLAEIRKIALTLLFCPGVGTVPIALDVSICTINPIIFLISPIRKRNMSKGWATSILAASMY